MSALDGNAYPARQPILPKGMGANALAPLAAILAGVIALVGSSSALAPGQTLAAFSCLLTFYLVAEAAVLRAEEGNCLWINPVVLASVLTFGLPYALSNLIFLDPNIVLDGTELYWMNELMLLAILAASAMWAGYRSGVGEGLEHLIERSGFLRRWLSPAASVNPYALLIFALVSLGGRLLAIQLGIYGYSSSIDRIYELASYREYLSIMEAAGRIALAALALQCFSSARPTFFMRAGLWLILCYEVAFGILSGFKSAVTMPFIIVGVVYYSQRNRFPSWLAPAVAGSILIAYVVIEPFRLARYENSQFDGTSIASIADTMSFDFVSIGTEGHEAAIALAFLQRLNLTYPGALGVRHAFASPPGEDAPQFLENIFLAPAHALVPRLLWPTKRLENQGAWYTRVVLGQETHSSTAMGPVTFLNYAGGAIAVIVGFLVVGILQRGLSGGLRHFGMGGWLVFLGLLVTLSIVPDAFDRFFVNTFRTLPMLIVAQRVLFRRSHPRPGTGI